MAKRPRQDDPRRDSADRGGRSKQARQLSSSRLPVETKQRASARPSKRSLQLLPAGAVTVIDLREKTFRLVLGNVRDGNSCSTLYVGTMGAWTLQSLTHHVTGNKRLIREGMVFVVDQLRTNMGFVDQRKTIVVPLNWKQLGIVFGQVQFDGNPLAAPTAAIFFPAGSTIYFGSLAKQSRGKPDVSVLEDDRGRESVGPWVVVTAKQSPSPKGAA